MKKQESLMMRELGKFVQAFWLELPLVAANRIFGQSDETALRQAGWKAYDTFVSLTNETTNLVYANPTVGSLTGQTTERVLRAQHVASAAASAFFGNLWSAVGLPTAGEIASLRDEVAALHKDLTEAVEAANQAKPKVAAPTERLSAIRNLKRNNREEDEDAAA